MGGRGAARHVTLNKESILEALPQIESIGDPISGGQKVVYPVTITGKQYALKTLTVNENPEPDVSQGNSIVLYDPIPRMNREMKILGACDIPQIVKLGPIGPARFSIKSQNFICYTEEWVEGNDLKTLIAAKKLLTTHDAAKLGIDMTTAIEALWGLLMIHRDIKPANIIRRASGDGYVLLDPGIALDLDDISLTVPGGIPGIPGSFPYYSPEQWNVLGKRRMDFRSDLFNLGMVMYEAMVGVHPFLAKDGDQEKTIENLLTAPPRPISKSNGITGNIEKVATRLMAKKPHLRYCSFKPLMDDLKNILAEEGGKEG